MADKSGVWGMKEYKRFEFIVCKRKSASQFIKIIMWIPDADGYIEIARINMNPSSIVTNTICIEELAKELS